MATPGGNPPASGPSSRSAPRPSSRWRRGPPRTRGARSPARERSCIERRQVGARSRRGVSSLSGLPRSGFPELGVWLRPDGGGAVGRVTDVGRRRSSTSARISSVQVAVRTRRVVAATSRPGRDCRSTRRRKPERASPGPTGRVGTKTWFTLMSRCVRPFRECLHGAVGRAAPARAGVLTSAGKARQICGGQVPADAACGLGETGQHRSCSARTPAGCSIDGGHPQR